MQDTKLKTISYLNVKMIANFLGLAGVATLLPFFIHVQWLTGPIINAILIITLFLVGIRSALVLCLIPSLMALASGLLPVVLAPAVPFIMLGNVILVLSVDWFFKNLKDEIRGFWAGVLVGSLLKFTFLYFNVSFITKLLVKQELAVKIAQMMSWPQFTTALTGGMIAFLALKWLKRI